MKLKYIGESFGIDGLTNGKIYTCIGIEDGVLRIIDDSDEDYMYSATNPRPLDGRSPGGRWEIVEDENGELAENLRRWEECKKYPPVYSDEWE